MDAHIHAHMGSANWTRLVIKKQTTLCPCYQTTEPVSQEGPWCEACLAGPVRNELVSVEDLKSLKGNFSLSRQLTLSPRTNSLSMHGVWYDANTRMTSAEKPHCWRSWCPVWEEEQGLWTTTGLENMLQTEPQNHQGNWRASLARP